MPGLKWFKVFNLNVYFRHKSKGLQRWTQEELQTEQRRKGDDKASLRSQPSSLAEEQIKKEKTRGDISIWR